MNGEHLLNNTSSAELTVLCVTAAAVGEWRAEMGRGTSVQCVLECRDADKGLNLIIWPSPLYVTKIIIPAKINTTSSTVILYSTVHSKLCFHSHI